MVLLIDLSAIPLVQQLIINQELKDTQLQSSEVETIPIYENIDGKSNISNIYDNILSLTSQSSYRFKFMQFKFPWHKVHDFQLYNIILN